MCERRKNKVQELAKAYGISDVTAFAKRAGISLRTAYNIWKPTAGLSQETMQAIVLAFPDESLESFVYVERSEEANGTDGDSANS